MVINFNAWLPFLLLVSSLFLAFSVSSTLGLDKDQQCQQECMDFQGLPKSSACLARCKNMGPSSGPPVAGGLVWYSQSHGQECRQECEKQGTRVPLEHCQRQCIHQRQFEQCHKQWQQIIQSSEICQKICRQKIEGGQGEELESYVSNHHELQQCQQHCQSQHGQKKHQCMQECQDQMRQQGQQQCQQRCQSQRGQKQHQCLQECQDQMRQQGQQGQQQYEKQQCQQSCQSQRGQKQHECMQECQDQMRQQGQQQCQQRCQSQRGQKQHQCLQECQDQMRQQGQQQQGGSTGRVHQNPNVQREEEQMIGGQRNNPFYFPSQMFQSRFQSNEGSLHVLERFGKSELLRGIKNYRLAILEAMPNTFVLPHHCDAEAIFVVLNGQCICTLLMKDRKESFNMEHGDVIRVPAGATTYLINNNNDEPLQIAKLIRSVNSPGRFEEFFPAGSGNPESYFSVFSNDILESAFNTPREQLKQGFRQQRGQQGGQGIVMRAPKEQLEALSQRPSSARREGRRQSQGPFNLRQQTPVHSNNYGQFFEARPEEFNQFQDMDVSVSCIEMNQQTMMVPHFNSEATFLMYVVEGNVRVEMACPHLASQMQGQEMMEQQEQGEHSGSFTKVAAQLSPGDAFVVPAGHPVAFVAQNNNGNQNQNIRILGFGLNAQNNMRNFLAGQKDNIMQQMDREAKQLAFGQEMERIFGEQQESYFVPTKKGRGRSHPLSSTLEFAGVI
ncbi:vicilin Jug r 2.0101 [Pyrus x bretschneideri]|uniref:vicilin Jug r 2.0101 n=1 Tax=Pyrus x bretschneideri TaxID=225117 RepID=UPI0020304E01|nr:vicilin Jug r 2.0101 [Pyrus x bretschneideri]